MIGRAFGRLTVIGLGEKIDGGYTYLCQCSCEKHTLLYVRGTHLRNGNTRSCGCLHDEAFAAISEKRNVNSVCGNTNVSTITYRTLPKNNTSGYLGVNWHKSVQKWSARITFQGYTYSLGYYDDIQDAVRVRKDAEEKFYDGFLDWYKAQYPDKWGKIQKRKEKKESRASI